MFVKFTNTTTTIVSVYIDDLIITENKGSEIGLNKHHLKNKFDVKDLGD